jgi:hypothetical protein
VHIVWFDRRESNNGEIYYNRSDDNGENWGTEERLTVDPGYSESPSVAVRDSIVHVVWCDTRSGDWEVYYKRSINNGENWGADERLTADATYPYFPSVAVRDSIVHIIWDAFISGNTDIYYKRSIDDGETWDIHEKITSDPDYFWDPSVAVSDSIVHVVWCAKKGGAFNREIYYKRSIDNGENWGIDERLSNAADYSDYPSIAACDSVVHVAWTDTRNGSSNSEVYYKRSDDNGVSWGIDERLTNAGDSSKCVSVACRNCDYDYDVHVTWTDFRHGNQNREIYYRRHECPPSSVEESGELKAESFDLKVKNAMLGEVRFSIHLPHSSLVELKVFDVSGRPVDSRQFALPEGTHEISWDNDRSGLYFLTFEAGDFKATKKLIILK